LGSLLLGLTIYNRNRKNKVNIVFTLLSLVVVFWGATLFFFQYPILFPSIIWLKTCYFLVLFLIGFLLLFSLVFPKETDKKHLFLKIFFLIPAFIFAYTIIFTNLFVADVVSETWGYKQILGSAYPIFGIWASIITGMAVFNLWKSYRDSKGIEKVQLKYISLGMFLFCSICLMLDVVFPVLLKNSKYIWASPAATIFLVGSMAYSIVKHRLMDIRIAFQGIIVFIITSLLAGVTIYIVTVIYWLIAGTPLKPGIFPIAIVVGFILSALFKKITHFAEYMVSKYFSGSIYDCQQIIKELNREFSSTIDLEKLAGVIVETLSITLKLNRVAVLIWNPVEDRYQIKKTIGFNEKNGISTVHHEFLTSYLEHHPQIIILEEVLHLVDEAKEGEEKKALREIHERMQHIQASLIIPVVNIGKLMGLVILGDKKSGDPYTVQDVNMFNAIANQASISFENAILYDQLSQINQNLLKRVDEKTMELQIKNKDLKQANEQLKQLDKMKDQLVAVTSHELKTPLSNAQNYLWMVLNKRLPGTSLDGKDKLRLERSLDNLQRLVKLIDDILNVSKIEGEKLDIIPEVIDFQKIIEETIFEMKIKAEEKGLKLVFEKLSKSIKLYADPLRLKEILVNLLSNAIKYTDKGSVKIFLKLEDKEIILSVEDTGRGIAEENLKNLFRKFYREDTALTASGSETGGTGLGLYITKSIIEKMGGKIWVKSVHGKGSTFSFSLPTIIPKKASSKTGILQRTAKGVYHIGEV